MDLLTMPYTVIFITLQQLVGQYWTPFTAQPLEHLHLSTNLNSSHTPAEICSEWLLDLDEQLLMAQTPIPVVSRAIDTCPCSCGRWELAKWPKIWPHLKAKYCYIDPRWWVIDENVISLRWWPFWKWCHIGSPSNLVMVACLFMLV